MERLNQGLAATHTTSNTYLECTLPLTVDGRNVDVCWPDYDGEQLYRQVTHRRITQEWQDRLRSADAWLLFVRLTITKRHKDILADPLETAIPTAGESTDQDDVSSVDIGDLSGQAKVIELLQILLHATGTDVSRPTAWPVLGVVVSCWDEVCTEDGMLPDDLLTTHAPLIHQFLEANWQAKSRFIIGLSSTGIHEGQDQSKKGCVLRSFPVVVELCVILPVRDKVGVNDHAAIKAERAWWYKPMSGFIICDGDSQIPEVVLAGYIS